MFKNNVVDSVKDLSDFVNNDSNSFYFIRIVDDYDVVTQNLKLNFVKEDFTLVLESFNLYVQEYAKSYSDFKAELFFISDFSNLVVELISSIEYVTIKDFLEFDYKILFSTPIISFLDLNTDLVEVKLDNADILNEFNASYASSFSDTCLEIPKISKDLDYFILLLNGSIANLNPYVYTFFTRNFNQVIISSTIFFKDL